MFFALYVKYNLIKFMFLLFVAFLIFSLTFEFFIQSSCSIAWVDTKVFAEWFEQFSQQITEQCPLLLFDGHGTCFTGCN